MLVRLLALVLVLLHTQAADHASNFGVIVCTSRFWFNYRHVANALAVYHTMKRLGVPDSNIILMLAEDAACNERNPIPANVFSRSDHTLNLYDSDVEVDYRGSQVTVENFLRVLTGRHDETSGLSQRLLSDDSSNVIVYLTGHGGDGFLKFQDKEELTSQDLADAFEQMHQQQRYKELMFIIDTCQGESMFSRIYSPRVISISSSLVGQNSYAYGGDGEIGVALVDRFTHFLLIFMEKLSPNSNTTLQDALTDLSNRPLMSTPATATTLDRGLSEILLMDFFANSRHRAVPTTARTIVQQTAKLATPPPKQTHPGNTKPPVHKLQHTTQTPQNPSHAWQPFLLLCFVAVLGLFLDSLPTKK